MADYKIRMENISKQFGNIIANDGVNLQVRSQEIFALLGENGAGKSTLMKILFGLYPRDAGSIWINGREMPAKFSPSDAMELGVAMVHQHFQLVEPFTVAQNIVLGAETQISRFLFQKKKVHQEVAALLERTGMQLPLEEPVRNLSLGDRQRVEILKALYRGCQTLILDEPTTVLTPQETDALFTLLRRLRDDGMTIIIITHKLREVLELSDRILVMRQGRQAALLHTAETNADTLASTMVGRQVAQALVEPLPCAGQETVLCLQNVHTAGGGCPLKGLDLRLYAGRVVGIAGVDGNGQTELAEVLAGILPMTEGQLLYGGRRYEKNRPEELAGMGIHIIPEDRHRQGLVLPLSVRENLMLGYREQREFRRGILFDGKKVNAFANGLIGQFDIRPPEPEEPVRNMSGGNQQKVVLARELSQPDLQIVVASQPTRGLDVGAIQFTHSQLLSLREQGKAVLLISSDLEEIRALSDEIAVLYDGKIAVQRPAGSLSNRQIGLYMGGSSEGGVQ